MADTPAIATDGLTKRFGRIAAVQGLHLTVEAGEVFGFLGLNGAGKTTTIRLLLDLLRPSSGRARILGFDCQTQGLDVRARVGYQPGELAFYEDMTGDAVLRGLARLSGRPVDDAWRAALLDRFALTTADLRRRLRDYSTGMKRKLAIVQAFQADPVLLILDEPTEGLDPLMQDAFYDLLADVRRRGRTIFMSSHVLSEVERVCDRIGLLRSGELALVSPVADVRRLAPRRVRVRFAAPVSQPFDLPIGCVVERREPEEWMLAVTGALGALVSRLAGLPVADLRVDEPHLEDVVREYYKGMTAKDHGMTTEGSTE